MTQIVIIEPHPLLRLGLAGLMTSLTSADRITTQGYNELYQSTPNSSSADLALLSAPPEERIQLLIQATRRAHAPKRLILMSEPMSPPAAWTNLPAIVVDYLSTNSSADSILAAVYAQLPPKSNVRPPFPCENDGQQRLSAVTARHSTDHNTHYSSTSQSSITPYKVEVSEAKMLGLSARQYQVLVLLAQGYPIKLICRELNISMATTKGHLEALYQRLGVHNRNEAVFVAMAQGATLKMNERPAHLHLAGKP